MRAHSAYDVMFKDSIAWLQTHQPAAAIAEQVCGFAASESDEISESPLDRPAPQRVSISVAA